MKRKTASEGQILFRVGDEGHEFFIVIEGYINMYVPKPDFKF